ncbi:hypothetical protein BU24DRAFT_490580 [Aaosphaeria arxii CBS 175.79]|uniref:Uncharacterized protein n=1 Tax=Aaosphaeria arxii CBS 175.79 TaxID=1450172 RepID=A0A6A5XVR2_9PLEO|nr:uncharacterized protein BU24DRAFT_490580 [Aaosphaeria arxii CBS 175.79]KAF2017408.1 hypothetical protein BU24DRAFT_490580 [Aaosphaeria arxii CBS 175.79]
MTKPTIASTAATLAALASTAYLLQTYRSISPIKSSAVCSSNSIPNSLLTSQARKLTNPKDTLALNDTRWTDVKVPRGTTDEVVLARFVRGFFGGYVFAPERMMLKVYGRDMASFEELKNEPVSRRIWSTSQLSGENLPPVGALFFGAFRVVESRVVDRSDVADGKASESYIDFAYGFDQGPLAGVHRFSVKRGAAPGSGGCEKQGKEEETVTIEFSHSGCNPLSDEWRLPLTLEGFHSIYAMLLFREGVAGVISS